MTKEHRIGKGGSTYVKGGPGMEEENREITKAKKSPSFPGLTGESRDTIANNPLNINMSKNLWNRSLGKFYSLRIDQL